MAVFQPSRMQALSLCFATTCLFGAEVARAQPPGQPANDRKEHASPQDAARVRTARDARVPPMRRQRPPEQHTKRSAAATASQSTPVSSDRAGTVAAAPLTNQATGSGVAANGPSSSEKVQSLPGRAGLGGGGVPTADCAAGFRYDAELLRCVGAGPDNPKLSRSKPAIDASGQAAKP